MKLIRAIDEVRIKMLYENSKYNRQSCKERAEAGNIIDEHMKNLEYFWGGNINAIHSMCDTLGLKFEWMSSREEDFNQYYKTN